MYIYINKVKKTPAVATVFCQKELGAYIDFKNSVSMKSVKQRTNQ